jgi:hypothetical protein
MSNKYVLSEAIFVVDCTRKYAYDMRTTSTYENDLAGLLKRLVASARGCGYLSGLAPPLQSTPRVEALWLVR